MKEFKKDGEMFVPQTNRAKELLKKIEQFNQLAEYFKSKEVQHILTEEFGTTSKERYVVVDSDEYVSPTKSYVNFSSYDNETNGRAFIYKDFSNITTDGKIGKKIAKRISVVPGFKKFDWKTHIKQVADNFKPGKKTQYMSLEHALQTNSKDRIVKVAQKLTELFEEQKLKIEVVMLYNIHKNSFLIHSIIVDYLTHQILIHEFGKSYSPFLLNASKEADKKVKERESAGYFKRTRYNQIKDKFNEWHKDKEKIEFSVPCSSAVMHNSINLRFITKIKDSCMSSYEQFEIKVKHIPLEDAKKTIKIAREIVDKEIP